MHGQASQARETTATSFTTSKQKSIETRGGIVREKIPTVGIL